MHKCKLIGIDSSTQKTGIAVFMNGEYNKAVLLDTSNIKIADDRYRKMCIEIITMLNKENPDIVVIERMHTIRNIDSLRKLCKIMGVVQGWCITNDCEYIELSPTEWRKDVNDTKDKIPRDRCHLKQWSVNKVKQMYGLDVTDDIADAICIGKAYINRFNTGDSLNGKRN